jgi:hypothetical protein
MRVARRVDQRRTSAPPVNRSPVMASLGPTSGWDYWRTVSIPITPAAGINPVNIDCRTDANCRMNIDTIAVTSRNAPLLALHAPLGAIAALSTTWTVAL